MRLGLLSAAWLAGLLLGFELEVGATAAWLLSGSFALVAVGMRLAQLPAFPAVLAAVLLLGLGRAEAYDAAGSAGVHNGREVVASGQIADDPEVRTGWIRFELQVRSLELEGGTEAADERWLVYADPPDDLVSRRSAPFFRYGDELTARGIPARPEPIDGFDYPAYLEAQGITTTLFAQETTFAGEGGSVWRAAIFAARGRLADSIEAAMPYPESALATAMLLGKRESLPTELAERFRGTGAAHLLAISGLHVGVLLAVAVGTAGWALGRQRPTYLIIAGAVVWLYALGAGASPSALRAAAMGTVYLAALGLGRPGSVIPALALAAAVMSAVSPGLLRQVSFQLSFAAVGGIALALAMLDGWWNRGVPPTAGWGRRITGWAVGLTVVSAAATLATWPLVAANFGEVALLSIPVSLLAILAVAPLIVATAVAAMAGLVAPPLGELLGWIATAPAAWLIGSVSLLPAWTVEADWVGRPLLLGWYGGLGLALLAARPQWIRRWRKALAETGRRLGSPLSSGQGAASGGWPLPNAYVSVTVAAGLAIAAVILWLRVAGGPDGYLHVHFLDVGQGDSTLITTPSGRQVLVDGGPEGDRVSQELAEALPAGDRSLDAVVMTHLDSDHSQGLLEVLDRYDVGAVVAGPQTVESAMGPQWEQRLRQHGIEPVVVREGHAIRMEEGVELQVLNPPSDRLFGESNNDSVALRLTYGAVSVLLAADMESEAELRLVRDGGDVSGTVLKAGHHGSRTSTTQRFVEAVGPSIAVVSAGAENPYGHPAPEVVERLEAAVGEEHVFRTDRDGTVEVVSDGTRVWVRTER